MILILSAGIPRWCKTGPWILLLQYCNTVAFLPVLVLQCHVDSEYRGTHGYSSTVPVHVYRYRYTSVGVRINTRVLQYVHVDTCTRVRTRPLEYTGTCVYTTRVPVSCMSCIAIHGNLAILINTSIVAAIAILQYRYSSTYLVPCYRYTGTL